MFESHCGHHEFWYETKTKKLPPNIPTGLGQRVKLRGREPTGEIVGWWPDHKIGLCCTVAWDWEFYNREEIPKGMAWFLIMPDELEVIN